MLEALHAAFGDSYPLRLPQGYGSISELRGLELVSLGSEYSKALLPHLLEDLITSHESVLEPGGAYELIFLLDGLDNSEIDIEIAKEGTASAEELFNDFGVQQIDSVLLALIYVIMSGRFKSFDHGAASAIRYWRWLGQRASR